jgi:integrin-linked kinase-associated serine/threonine phosphatase 2C
VALTIPILEHVPFQFIFKTVKYISRAVMYRVTAKERLAIELSYDHKPTRSDER